MLDYSFLGDKIKKVSNSDVSFQKNIDNYIKGELLKSSDIMHLYFNKTLDINNDSINEILKISYFLNRYFTNINMYEEILNNNKVNILIKKFVDENMDVVIQNNVSLLINNKYIVNLIELYCVFNNIEIVKDYDVDVSDNCPIYQGDFLDTFDKTIERDLFAKYKNGDKSARELLIKSNLKLVIYIAKTYYGLIETADFDFSDIIEEGNIGLIKALEKFDYSKNFKFSTYASWWIKQSILIFLKYKSNLIRIPVYKQNEIKHLKNIINKFYINNGHYPTSKELSLTINCDISKIDELLMLSEPVLNLDFYNDEYLDEGLFSKINVEDEIINKEFKKLMKMVLENSKLTKEEKELIEYRFKNNKTLNDISLIKNMSISRVEYLLQRALAKIRRSKYVLGLLDYTTSKDDSYIMEFRKNLVGDKSPISFRREYALELLIDRENSKNNYSNIEIAMRCGMNPNYINKISKRLKK